MKAEMSVSAPIESTGGRLLASNSAPVDSGNAEGCAIGVSGHCSPPPTEASPPCSSLSGCAFASRLRRDHRVRKLSGSFICDPLSLGAPTHQDLHDRVCVSRMHARHGARLRTPQ